MPSTDIYILGQKYTIKGDADARYIQRLSEDINRRINDVISKFPNIQPNKALILTLFNLAEELDRQKSEQNVYADKLEQKAALLTSLFE